MGLGGAAARVAKIRKDACETIQTQSRWGNQETQSMT